MTDLTDCFTEQTSFDALRIHARFFVDGEEFSKQSAGTAWSEDADTMYSFQAGDVVTVILN